MDLRPRPVRDLDARVYTVLARGGRWTQSKIASSAYACQPSISQSLARLTSQGLAVRFGKRPAEWVAVDPRGIKIKDIEAITQRR